MQGLVTLDFGNSSATAGIFILSKTPLLKKKVRFDKLKESLIELGLSAHNCQIVLSDVKPREEELKFFVEEGFLITRVKDYWRGKRFHGMPVNYTETLGEDRLITSFFAYKSWKVPLLIIDAGTFVTMDLVTPEGFQGGYIIPGVEAYLETFKRGENLKSVDLHASALGSLPQQTDMAMSESYKAFAALARNIILEHHVQKVLITGGASSFWGKLLSDLPSSTTIEIHPDLIHSALVYWMTTQIEPL